MAEVPVVWVWFASLYEVTGLYTRAEAASQSQARGAEAACLPRSSKENLPATPAAPCRCGWPPAPSLPLL